MAVEPRPSAIKNILLVDPSLFTAPYDAALSAGLETIGLRPRWAVRELRPDEDQISVASHAGGSFYRLGDGRRHRKGRRLLKGFEHLTGLKRLVREARDQPTDIVHFQWTLLPLLDARAIAQLQQLCPVVVTVHDSTPFNGKRVSSWQRRGLGTVLRRADRIIVHTPQSAAAVAGQGIASERVTVVPHGVLPARRSVQPAPTGRWRIVLFGKLQLYKGVDVLVDAIRLLDEADRQCLSIIVAGEPMIDLTQLIASARASGVGPELLDFRLFRHSDAEMSAVLGEADAFVFPYRAIDASGVLFAVAPLGRWLIASALGAFSDLIGPDQTVGQLVPPDDAGALAAALRDSINRQPTRDLSADVPSWTSIAKQTRAVYDDAWQSWRAGRPR